jgi:hypothetical protein
MFLLNVSSFGEPHDVIPEDGIFHSHRRSNLRYYRIGDVCFLHVRLKIFTPV